MNHGNSPGRGPLQPYISSHEIGLESNVGHTQYIPDIFSIPQFVSGLYSPRSCNAVGLIHAISSSFSWYAKASRTPLQRHETGQELPRTHSSSAALATDGDVILDEQKGCECFDQ